MTFSLDPRLGENAEIIVDLPLSRVLLSPDANYPWLILVPWRADVVEIIDLNEEDRHQLMTEIAVVSDALKAITGCDKLNVAALGNMVPQLHVHIIARWKDDAAWPGPIWGVKDPIAYDSVKAQELCDALRNRLQQDG